MALARATQSHTALCDRESPAVADKPAPCQFVFTAIRATQPQVWNTRTWL